ncbi:MAG: NAD(P)H-dependent oxidoreductase [Candidatus Saccharimonadales bacterium]
MTKLAIIIGSVRQDRVSDKFASWIAAEAKAYADVEIVDLKDHPLPLFDEPVPPRYNPKRSPIPVVQTWLSKLSEFDGYIIVTPEYNRSMPGVLKNAIDYIAYEIDKKPVALVGHGSSGGAQSIANLRSALPGVGAVTVPEAMYFAHRVNDAITPENELTEELKDTPYGPRDQLASVLTSLVWYSDVLKTGRE